MPDFDFGGSFVWRPAADIVAASRLQRFIETQGLESLEALQAKAATDAGWFWDAVMRYLDIQFFTPYSQVVDLSQGKPWPRWCVGGKMNVVHNCLDKWVEAGQGRRMALRWEGEEGATRMLTYDELLCEVSRCSHALTGLGLGKGDVVALFMPMVPEIAVALLAVARIGGIVLPLFSGYGSEAVATRLMDAGAKALVTTDGAFRRGKLVGMKQTADEAIALSDRAGAASVQHVLVARRTGQETPWTKGRDHWWHEVLKGKPVSHRAEPADAEDTLMIIYTSGTTGRPKGAVHSHCGFPIKAAQDMMMGLDMGADDTLYWITDMGWMMGPWEVFGTLLLGGAMLLYDGAPDYPDAGRLWKLVQDHHVSILGVSPTLIRSLMTHGEAPIRRHNLRSLRLFGSTGEPWNPEPWMWLFQQVGEGNRPIINYSGGTEVSGGIVMGNVLTPLKPAAFSGPAVGMAADVVDEDGKPVRGRVGELVVREPWLGMTRGFWRDPERYLETYWSRFPGVWVHGDFAAIDEDGQWYILGRSDDTIKIAGKRLGPAEVESVLVRHPAVIEAGAIGVPHAVKGSELVCFVVLSPGATASEDLARSLKDLVAAALGKALRPAAVLFVADLPKTRNAKVMRRLLRAAYLGEPTGDLSSLVNPEIVEEIGNAAGHGGRRSESAGQ